MQGRARMNSNEEVVVVDFLTGVSSCASVWRSRGAKEDPVDARAGFFGRVYSVPFLHIVAEYRDNFGDSDRWKTSLASWAFGIAMPAYSAS